LDLNPRREFTLTKPPVFITNRKLNDALRFDLYEEFKGNLVSDR